MDDNRKIILPFDKVFCLNLCERSDRRDFMKQQFERLGILDQITWHEAVKHSFGDGNIISKALGMSGIGWLNNDNEYNCAREHYTIIKSSYLNGCDHILILEDDISLLNNKELFREMINLIPRDYDILRLGAIWTKEYISGLSGKPGWELCYKDFHGALGYALNREGMRYIITCQDHYFEAADSPLYRSNRIKINGLKMYSPTIPLIIIKENPWITRSDIQTIDNDSDLSKDSKYSQLPLDYSLYG